MISSSCLANRRDQAPDSPAEHRTAPAPAADRPADPVAGRLLLPAHQPRRRRHPRRVGALGERRAALCRGDRREPAAHLRRACTAGADLQDPAGRSLVLVHRLGGGRHLRLVLGLPPPGEAGAVGRPCADRGAAAAGPAVPVHRAAQRAFRPARAHPVRRLRALHDRLDGPRRGHQAGPRLVDRHRPGRGRGVGDEATLSRHPRRPGTLPAVPPRLAHHAQRSHPVGDRAGRGRAFRVDVHDLPRIRQFRHAARRRGLCADRRLRAGATC